MIKLRYKLGAIVVGAFILSFFLKHILRTDVITVKKGDEATILVSPNKIKSVTKTRTGTVRKDVPNYGHGELIVVHTDNTVTIQPVLMGLSNDVGFSTDFTRAGVALEVAYYRRLNLLVGSHMWNMRTQKWDMNLFVGIGYRLPWNKVNNLSVFTAIDTDQRVIGGLFIRFGSS